MSGAVSSIGTAFTSVVDGLSTAVGSAVSGVGSVVATAASAGASVASGIGGAIGSVLNGASSVVSSVFGSVGTGLGSAAGTAASTAATTAGTAASTAGGFLSSQAGIGLLGGIGAGLMKQAELDAVAEENDKDRQADLDKEMRIRDSYKVSESVLPGASSGAAAMDTTVRPTPAQSYSKSFEYVYDPGVGRIVKTAIA